MEIKANSAQAYPKTCIGCQRNGGDMMLTFMDEKGGNIHDVFLTTEQAMQLRVQMDRILAAQEAR